MSSLLLLLLATGAGAEALPTPTSLEPAVRFWTRVYTEVDTQAGLVHDSENLAVVYETLRFPKGLSHRARERRIEKSKKKIRAALHGLAKGRRSALTGDQARVLAQWPDGVSDATLRRAASHVRFQLGQANKFRDGLARSGAWRAFVLERLEAHDVPLELVALPHVESSYNTKAYSRVGAAGMWQFTRSTGRLFMRVDSVVDERLDPFVATDAAARLLAKNYEITGAWPLAITAYNHGAGGMRRAARKLGTKDIGEIVRRYKSRTFGFASRNFYASFLAASAIDRDPERYFGKVPRHSPRRYAEFELPWYAPADEVARALGVEVTLLREHNPGLRPSVWNGSKHVPKGYKLRLPSGVLAAPVETLVARVPDAARLASQHRDTYHKVRRGETLSRIAKRYGVRMSELMALNNLRSRHRIRSGQVLVLPDRVGGSTRIARETAPADGVYRVRRGDALSSIAARFGLSERELAAANGIRNRHKLYVGQRLKLPGAAKPVVVASAGEDVPLPQPAPAPPEPAPEPPPEPAVAAVSDAAPEEAVAPPVAPAPLPTAEPEEPAEEEQPPAAREPGAATASASAKPDDPSDYSVHGNRITVQAAETLGHYAEWLEIRASRLRQLNGLRFGKPVVIGKRLKLDFARVTPQEFEQRRLEYHQALQTDFFNAFAVTGTESHVLKSGETLWYLAKRKYRVPVWLLRQYNPDLDFAALHAGATMVVPIVEARAG